MFKILRQLGSVLLLCSLLLSINSYAFADEYQDCLTEIKQQAKNLCETFENEFLNECNQTKKFEGITYSTILECQQALQSKIDTCIQNFESQNISICVIFDPNNVEAEMAKCIDDKIKSSDQYSQLAKLKTEASTCQQIAVTEHQAYYDQCDSIANTKCEAEYVDVENSCYNNAFNDCRARADKEREIKDTKCRENYVTLYNQLSEKAKTDCEAELKAAQSETTTSTNCGNGKKDTNEECDDGNTTNGDGCSSECKIEAVVPPDVPQIDTLVGPDVEKVNEVNPYLSTTFLPRVAKTVVSFGIGAAVIGLIMGSIGMLTAYGNDEKYGNAKKAVMFSLIGLVICILSFAIVQLIFFTGYQAGQIK